MQPCYNVYSFVSSILMLKFLIPNFNVFFQIRKNILMTK